MSAIPPKRHAILLASLLALAGGCGVPPKQAAPDLQTIAEEAYIFGYPLVLMDVTRQVMTAVPKPVPGKAAPMNHFMHRSEFPDATFTDVVSPNADTYYSSAWLDLSAEPMIMSVPDTRGRYYVMQMLDGWTNVFAAPGARTTGTAKANFAIVGPTWQGPLPAGVQELRSPTNMVWILGRTQVNSKSDGIQVTSLQRQYRLTPLSRWGKRGAVPARVPVDSSVNRSLPPADQVEQMDAAMFFGRLARLMKANPPAAADSSAISRFAALGLQSGQDFDLAARDTATQGAMTRAVPAAFAKLKDADSQIGARQVNGWRLNTGVGQYGTDYLKRAHIALVGLGANLPADACYPFAATDSSGTALNGESSYVIHFAKGQLPPVNAFWSLTLYNDRHFFVENPINRYALGDRSPLTYNADSSLDVYIQHDNPGPEHLPNWLPAPAGSFNLIMRLYWPKPSVIDGTWQPPGIGVVLPS